MHIEKDAAAVTAATNEMLLYIITSIENALNNSFKALKSYPQFVACKFVPNKNGKVEKIPVNYKTGINCNPLDPINQTDSDTALHSATALIKKFKQQFGVGFVFTKKDPFFFLDIDNCYDIEKKEWSALANKLCHSFSNAALEISYSGKALHIFGTYTGKIKHKCKNKDKKIELYTDNHFVAFTGYEARGDISLNCTTPLLQCTEEYFNANKKIISDNSNSTECYEWSTEPVAGWHGYIDDDELIQRALKSKSPRGIFGLKASFQDLFEENIDRLSRAYPPNDTDIYNRSSADAGLAQHFAFWTGNNCERIRRLMLLSKLAREKWDRKDYLDRTIRNACSQQNTWHNCPTHAGQPESLPELPAVIPFNYSYLPSAICEYVQDISERMQCPPDFPAVATLSMLAVLIGRKVGIRPKQKDSWTVTPNIWVMVIGNSGVMKSPALKEAIAPLKKLEEEAYQIFNKEMKECEIEKEFTDLKKIKNRTEAKRQINKKTDEEVKSLLKTNRIENCPILKRFTTNNSSYEALGEILIENPNGALVEADELIGILNHLDASGQEAARAFYLTGADGDKPYTFDRIKRGKGLRIQAVCISMLGGIQPGVISDYVRQAVNGGAGADGLMQRFGIIVYPDISPHWKDIDRLPSYTARQIVSTLVEKLNKLNYADIGAETDPYGGIPFLRFDDAAQVLFSKWRAELEHRLRLNEEHPALISHFSKYRKLIPALALINHLCDEERGPVSVTALQRAIDFSKYLESHALRVYSFATRPDIDAAKILLKHLANGKLSSPFTSRDVYRKGWAGLASPNKSKAAINVLLEYGHLLEEPQSTGGKDKTLYHWIKSEKQG